MSVSEISIFNFHTLLQLIPWIIEDSIWSHIIFTPVEMIANTFELFQLGIKESWKASLLPSVPLHGEWNQSLNIKTSNSSCWTNVVVTGREGGVHLHFTHFLSFHSSTLRSLSSVTSKVKRTEKKIFSYFLFFKEARLLWAIEAWNG